MRPVNYFRSREFSTALKVGITNAVGAALLAGFTSGFDGRNIDRYLFHTNANLAANSTIAVNESIRFDAGQGMKISGQIAATTGSPRVYGTIQLELVRI